MGSQIIFDAEVVEVMQRNDTQLMIHDGTDIGWDGVDEHVYKLCTDFTFYDYFPRKSTEDRERQNTKTSNALSSMKDFILVP